ncbi:MULTISPECIES: hypothetical protein [unclassified Micromonospora]|uniref:hypothetical protein n=1 Tax=unclassified Micromonospora TaxID=2617518 RepID=UPI0022B6B6A8|nr:MULTISPECIES: hypothetical protein [unclassified Micromonospora]MCZ7422841.1 hypothetical protein [Verrucosispora sp. WMMA2121]WBB90575.1 hypothetical protein O7597_26990 [Verrucosispora sp. WMMC514]
MGAAAVGVGLLIGALSSDPASADSVGVPSAGADRQERERDRPTSPLDELVTGLVERPDVRRSGEGRSSTRGLPVTGRRDDDRRADEGGARGGRPARPPATTRTGRVPTPDGPVDPSPGSRSPADPSLTSDTPGHRAVAARTPRDGSSKGSGPVGRTPVTPPSRSTVPIVGDRPPAPEPGLALPPPPEVTRPATGLVAPPVPGDAATALAALPATGLAALPGTALTALPATGLAALPGTALAALPATEAVVVLSQAVLRPVLVAAVAVVGSGVATVTTPLTQLPDLVTGTLPVLPPGSAAGPYTGGEPTSWTSVTAPVAGVPPPARSLAPDPPPAAPRATPPHEVTPAVPVAGVSLGWPRFSAGTPEAGSGLTQSPTRLPQRPHPPAGDGVTGADGGPAPLRGMVLDGCQVPPTVNARTDVPAPRRYAGRFPGVSARPG